MPEVQDLYEFSRFIYTVVDQDRRMDELAHSIAACNWTPDEWKSLQQVQVIQQSNAESFRGVWEVRPGVGEDLFEVRQRGF